MAQMTYLAGKGPKLPKVLWVSGKSKFLHRRMKQEGIPVDFWFGGSHDSPMSKLCRKYGVTEQVIRDFKKGKI